LARLHADSEYQPTDPRWFKQPVNIQGSPGASSGAQPRTRASFTARRVRVRPQRNIGAKARAETCLVESAERLVICQLGAGQGFPDHRPRKRTNIPVPTRPKGPRLTLVVVQATYGPETGRKMTGGVRRRLYDSRGGELHPTRCCVKAAT